ncbi:MerC domain-containing protein [Dyella lutea]|uniref:MerC domain-containing protein n=1 Tax=Dyella lutea TaxID=2950441 RepID=A0ABT1FEB1_9GAMM|nr:MerC domain-containing protein [Dyella lutea]MCP1375726.1 MerC domain-containing protein [Dyella lutea]
MQPEPSDKSFWWHVADRIGATASFLCAIHCAALPFLLAILPLVGLEFLASHAFERGFVMFASALALFSLGRGYRRHRVPQPLTFALPGLTLLLLGVTLAEGYSIVVHSVLVTIGGLLLAFSHFLNLRADRLNGHIHGPTCVH